MEQKILSLLARHGLMTLATKRADGWPQATSVSYVHRGLFIYFLISRSSQKFANIQADGRVSICIASASSDPHRFEGLSMAATALEPLDEPYRAEVVSQMRSRHPEYFDTFANDMTRSALMRALPQVISVVDFSQGLGHSDLLAVNADMSLEVMSPRPDNWGPDPANRPDRRADWSAWVRAEG